MVTQQVSMAYRVLAVCTGFNVVSRGVAESFAVFLLPLSLTFDASRAETTLAYSSFMLVLGLCSVCLAKVHLIRRFKSDPANSRSSRKYKGRFRRKRMD